MDQKQQIAEKLKQANNILVTVSTNPSVDQLAACIGLSLALNKLGKHATAVFSGTAPSTIEFLQPEQTFEDDIDSLRDFIISLDKAKADKLRYKVEDTVVKIFITPYHTSISDKDLEFSQGDFNVDAVVALGVKAQADIDQAIAAHGRILHDATVVTLNVAPGGEFGGINWMDPAASSLCELVTELVETMDKQAIDSQIATALLTGIVAETNRFSNNKTSPVTMSVSASLMAAGANQQLVVTKLETAVAPPSSPEPTVAESAPGEIKISRTDTPDASAPPNEATLSVGGGAAEPPRQAAPEPLQPPEEPKPEEEAKPVASLEELTGPDGAQENKEPGLARIHIDDQGGLHAVGEEQSEARTEASTDPTLHMGGSRMILHPPSMGGESMNSGGLVSEAYGDPLTSPKTAEPAGSQPSGAPPAPAPPSPFMPPSSASGSPSPMPFIPPSMTPPSPAPLGPPAPSPANPDASPDLAAAGPLGPSGPAPSSTDSARSAVAQAFGAPPPPPPDLNVPVPAGTPPPPPPVPSVPAPVGPPPPVPPPMLPTQP